MSDPGLAQPTPSPIEVVSKVAGGGPTSPSNTGPVISDDGTVVVFDTTTPDTDPTAPPAQRVMFRDRAARTTQAVPDQPSLHPGVSGDGCVIAYSVPDTASGAVQLVALDRCPPAASGSIGLSSVVVDTIAAPSASDGALPAPALSSDGSVIVWSTGATVRRYLDQGSGFTLANTIVPPATTPVPDGSPATLQIGARVDVSSDGKVIVFVAGPGSAPYEVLPANVFVWTAGTVGVGATPPTVQLVSATSLGQPISGSSSAPSISGDSRIVSYQSDNATLAVTGANTATAPFVVVVDRLGASRVLASNASRPAVSTDGTSIAYDSATDVHRKRSVGTTPFASVSDVSLSTAYDGVSTTGPSASGPTLSGNGAVGVFDSAAGSSLINDGAFDTGTFVWARTIDDTPPTTTTTAPPTTAAPATTTPRSTTTVPTGSTTTTTTVSLPVTTVPSTTVSTRPVPTTTPAYRPSTGGSSGRGGSSSSGSGRSVGSSTVTYQTAGSIEVATFVPSGVDFSPTIVGAGRQTTSLVLTNPTSRSLTVVDTSVQNDPDVAFSIVDSTCAAVAVPPGGTCALTVAFAPVTLGASSAAVVATLSDGSTATALLSGTGAPPPIVTVVPGVASSGQVVAVQGSGFPGGLVVEVTWLGSDIAQPVLVDANGSFVETMIVLPHTPRGPGTVIVAGQPDQFATVVGDVLITDTSDRSSSVLTHSAGSPFAS